MLYRCSILGRRCPEGHFEGNPLSPRSIGLSPLHPTHLSRYTSSSCGPPSFVRMTSPWSGVDHNGFGSDQSDWTRITTSPLITCGQLLSLRISARHANQLHGSCFEKKDTTLVLFIDPSVARSLFWKGQPFCAVPFCNRIISGLFTLISECFSAFARATCSLSVLSSIFRFRGWYPHIRTPNPGHGTLLGSYHHSFTYEAITRSGMTFQSTSVQMMVIPTTSTLYYYKEFSVISSAFTRCY